MFRSLQGSAGSQYLQGSRTWWHSTKGPVLNTWLDCTCTYSTVSLIQQITENYFKTLHWYSFCWKKPEYLVLMTTDLSGSSNSNGLRSLELARILCRSFHLFLVEDCLSRSQMRVWTGKPSKRQDLCQVVISATFPLLFLISTDCWEEHLIARDRVRDLPEFRRQRRSMDEESEKRNIDKRTGACWRRGWSLRGEWERCSWLGDWETSPV